MVFSVANARRFHNPPVEMEPGSVWGIPVSTIVTLPQFARTLAARGTAPGGTGPAAATAAARFEALAELLLEAAPREMLLWRLGEALSQTASALPLAPPPRNG